MSKSKQIFPGMFQTSADFLRSEYDVKNAQILEKSAPVDIVFVGDSITNSWELAADFHTYGLVLNRGIGGDVAEILRYRFEADVVQLHPKVCVMLIGVNSLSKLDREPDCSSEDMASFFEENYRPMMEMAKEAGIRMVLCSVMPLRGEMIPQIDRRNRAVVKMNEIIRKCADEYGFSFVDFHKAFVGDDGYTMREGLSHDGLHANYLGYNVMADLLHPVLDSLLK